MVKYQKKLVLAIATIVAAVLIYMCIRRSNFQISNRGSFGGSPAATPWSPNPCPTGSCPECPCPPQKPCPSCKPQLIDFQQYGPSSINDASNTPLPCPPGYTTQAGDPNSCFLPPNLATKACLSDSSCVGLFFNPGNNGLMKLVNVQPYNSGPINSNIYYEKL